MAKPIPKNKLLYLVERKQWREWLKRNYQSEDDIWLVYAKKHSGQPRISYNDAVEEALCFGWIDSIVKTVDEDYFAQRFSVRKAKGKYSQLNRERLRLLIKQGKIMKDVLDSLPDIADDDFQIPPDILEALKANKDAWRNLQTFSDAYLRIRIAYIDVARERPDIFKKRLDHFLLKTEQNKQFGHGGIEKYY